MEFYIETWFLRFPSLTIIGQGQRSNISIPYSHLTPSCHGLHNLKKHELKTLTIQLRLKNGWQPFPFKQSHICHHHRILVRGTGSRMSLRTRLGCQSFGIDPQGIPCDLTPVRSMGIPIHQIRIIQQNPKQQIWQLRFKPWFQHVCTTVEVWLLNLSGLKIVTWKFLRSTTSLVISRALLTKMLG